MEVDLEHENEENYMTRELVCVLFPGVVKNDEKALECLGGIRNISQIYSNSANERLGLSFRPENPYAKKVFADIKKTCGVLLKVKVRKTVTGTEVKREVLFTSVVGRVNQLFQFNSLSDFQYLPIDTDVQPPQCLIESLLPSGLDRFDSFINTPVKPFIVPTNFAQSDKTLCYAYTDKKEDSKTEQDNIYPSRESRKGFNTQISFDLVKELPSEPSEPIAKYLSTLSPRLRKVYDIVKEAFEERPIWSKSAIKYNTKLKHKDLKTVLPCLAFICRNGPWKFLWIKYGYDPRKEPESRKYQCLDFRLRQDAYLKSSVMKDSKKVYKRTVSHVRKPMNRDETIPQDEDDIPEVTVRYRPGMVPTQRQIYYQYCDILIPEVQQMMGSSAFPGSLCDLSRGWLLPGASAKCREILTQHARHALQEGYHNQSGSSSEEEAANSDCEPSTSSKNII